MGRIAIRVGRGEYFLLGLLAAKLTVSAADHSVAASNYKFSPPEVRILVGDTVTWTNAGGGHNVASSSGLFRNEISADPWQFQFTFNTTGTFSYVCQQHQNGGYGIPAMVGSVQVRSSNAPPAVAVASPSAGAVYAANDIVTLAANATDDGVVSHVEFFDGARSLGIVRTSPFTLSVALSPGNHALVANAVDNNASATMSGPVNIEVSSNYRPAISVTSPTADKHIVLPDPINLNVQVIDPEGAVAKVEYINLDDNSNISRTVATVYSAPFNLPAAPLPAGIARITAVVTDSAGFSSTSAPVRFFVSERIRLSIIQDRPGWFTFRTSRTFGTVTFLLSTDLRVTNWVVIDEGSAGGGMIENSFRLDQPRMLFRTRVD